MKENKSFHVFCNFSRSNQMHYTDQITEIALYLRTCYLSYHLMKVPWYNWSVYCFVYQCKSMTDYGLNAMTKTMAVQRRIKIVALRGQKTQSQGPCEKIIL